MLLAQRAQFAKAQHYVPQKSCQTISASTLRRPCTAPPRQPSAGHVRVRCQLSGTVTAVRDPTSTGSDASAPSGNTKAAGDAAATTQKLPPRTPYVPSGPPETTWYCWPEGFIGQSFSLAGKLQPRASPLLEDVDTLYQFTVRRRESCRYTEHTVDSSESASEMVEAVVGGAVDMGLFNASGSASLSMSREYSSRAVSHALVASFQENELLEMVKPSLTDAAKKVLMTEGPYAFAARYGTHFVSGVGHRGAFIGSITVKLSNMQLAAAASASFKASYGACSGMAELKGEMNNKLSTSNVTFRWHKWGVEDDESLTLLEQYCASEDAKFAGMRVLAMHTADQAKGYPKLIKLRPYSTLPDYVEACSRYCKEHSQQDDLQLQDIEQALAYLTKQYRKASYIKQVIDNDRRLGDMNSVGLAGTKDSLAHQVKVLVRYMEEVFKSKPDSKDGPPSMYQLCTFFKYTGNDLNIKDLLDTNGAGQAYILGRRIKEKLDEVDQLNYELFKAVQRPILDDQQREQDRRSVHVAVAADADKKGAFGRWWLDHQEQETFTKPGLYVVRLAWNQEKKLQQVGRTRFWEKAKSESEIAELLRDAHRFIKSAIGDDGTNTGFSGADNVFVMFAVGRNTWMDLSNDSMYDDLLKLTKIYIFEKYRTRWHKDWPVRKRGSWAGISFMSASDSVSERKGVALWSGSTANKIFPYFGEMNRQWTDAECGYDPKQEDLPQGMVLLGQYIPKPAVDYNPDATWFGDGTLQLSIDKVPLDYLQKALAFYTWQKARRQHLESIPGVVLELQDGPVDPARTAGMLVEVKQKGDWSQDEEYCWRYEVNVTNPGPAPLTSMKLLVTPPAGVNLFWMENVTRQSDEGGAWVFDLPDSSKPAGLAPGAALQMVFVVKGPRGSSQLRTGSIELRNSTAAAVPPASSAVLPGIAQPEAAPAAAGLLTIGTLEVRQAGDWDNQGLIYRKYEVQVINRSAPATSMRLLVTPPAGGQLSDSWNCKRLPDQEGAWVFDLPDWCQPTGLELGAALEMGFVVAGGQSLGADAVMLSASAESRLTNTPSRQGAVDAASTRAGRLTNGKVEVNVVSAGHKDGVFHWQYALKVTNLGLAPATSMELLVTPPAETELVESLNCTRLPDQGGSWVFDLPAESISPAGLPPGAVHEVNLTVSVPKQANSYSPLIIDPLRGAARLA